MNSSGTVANGIGQPVWRKEDFRLLTGSGSFADDVLLSSLAHAAIVRSPHTHAQIASITQKRRLVRPVRSRCLPAATIWRMGSRRSPTVLGSWARPMM